MFLFAITSIAGHIIDYKKHQNALHLKKDNAIVGCENFENVKIFWALIVGNLHDYWVCLEDNLSAELQEVKAKQEGNHYFRDY